MTPLPSALRDYLATPSLSALWSALRERLERTGHAVRGTITVPLDDEAADRLGGLLARPLRPGPARVRLADLDTALRASAAARGLVATVAELTGAPLRDRPAERQAARAGRERLWAHLEAQLLARNLADRPWVEPWTQWLHRGGTLSRLPTDTATSAIEIATAVLATVLREGHQPCALAELATRLTGNAHGLDDGTPAALLALRALAFALDVPPPDDSAQRRTLWQRVDVSTDEISGTVLTYGLRPPGTGRWSGMMRERADLGLITHLTVHELRRASELTAPGEVIHVCENPQVLQRLAAAGVGRPLACTSGNPSAAGLLLLARTRTRYHGDFDWPGIAIARRIFERDTQPWRLHADDYREAIQHLPSDNRLPLTGRTEPTPWDTELAATMAATGVAVHEEAIVQLLISDVH